MHPERSSGIPIRGATPALARTLSVSGGISFEKNGQLANASPASDILLCFDYVSTKFSSGLKFLVPQETKVAFLELCGAFPEPKRRRLRINDWVELPF